MTVPLSWYLIFATALFSIGFFAVLVRRNAIAVLMGVELMLNAVNINLVAFWRYLTPADLSGQIFVVFVFAVAAAEAAVGLALMISIYRTRKSINVDELNELKL
ncbi:MAG TPA: NADH-quinone oxidoreductase subunit NuoK [Anaerolineae bacterium]|nr:NADH-quinone oxidoreductase subunit NuoK [Caldilineae bacterium]HID35731.1 NADH-quinone oxidoreductase subunit NuoK [Anaerolineae bacterium]